jgi:hypothetical protein
MTTTNERELFQNHERRTCSGCGARIMKSRHAYRYATGEVRCTVCPAPVAAPVADAFVSAHPLDLTSPFVRERLGLNVRDSSETFMAGLPSLDSLDEG